MTIYFKDEHGTIRTTHWALGHPKPFNVLQTMFMGMVTLSKAEAEAVHTKFDNIPKPKILDSETHYTGDTARFILANL